MIGKEIVTDMAVEAAQQASLGDLCRLTKLSYGIERRYLNIKSVELAKKTGREKGVYITFDCPRTVYENNRAATALEKHLASAVEGLIGILRKSSPVLVIGLGNPDVVADSLGERAVGKISVNRQKIEKLNVNEQCVCTLSTNVFGATGIQSVEVAQAVTEKIKPTCIILIDSLATASVNRLGTSFQLSTAGIAPGSGVGQDKDRIDKSVLGVPVVAIGVPLMLSLRTAIYSFVKDYTATLNCENDEFKLREQLIDKKLSNLVVAPKEIDFYAETAACIIANALNMLFTGK